MANPFQLRTTEILQLLYDEEFYDQNLVFFFMKDSAMASIEKYHQAVVEKETTDCCGSADENRHIVGVVATFVRTLKGITGLNSTGSEGALQSFKEYLSGKLGWSVSDVVLYYKSGEKNQRLEF